MAPKNTDDQEPEKIIKRTLSPESHADRKIKSVFTDADIILCKQLISNLSKPGRYFQGKTVRKITAAAARKLWGNGDEN